MPISLIMLLIVITQGLYSYADLLATIHMKAGFAPATLCRPWFAIYMLVRLVATFAQLYVISLVPLGWMSAAFGACSIVAANVLMVLVMRQMLTPVGYIGVALSILAFLVMAVGASSLISSQRAGAPSSQAAASTTLPLAGPAEAE
jgi:hypothetical protein